MLKKHSVVMLPTNQKTENSLVLNKVFDGLKISTRSNSGNKLFDTNSYDDTHVFQHLYFLSNEEIKEGDWILLNNHTVTKCLGKTRNKTKCPTDWQKDSTTKKIIATTNKLLIGIDWMKGQAGEYDKNAYLPQPSQSFIDVFVREYNKGNVIKEVMVEYEGFGGKSYDINNIPYRNGYRLKINPKDNTITIKRVKDSWNREEIVNLLHLIIDTYPGGPVSKDITNNWIENNL